MNTPKKGSYSLIFYTSLIVAITIAVERMSPAAGKTTAEVLIETHRLSAAITPAEVKSTVDRLETVLADCEDSYLVFRIRYKIGIIYFKAGMMEISKARFVQIANNPKCPERIKVCSFNMIGQISRLRAENKEALEAFSRVANLLEQSSFADREHALNPTLTKLWVSAYLSKAEIYELHKDYTASIIEYGNFLHALNQSTNKDTLNRYSPLVIDRMSQLYLRQRNIKKYRELTEELIEDYSEYHRTPLAKMELECVKFLKSIFADMEFIKNGSFGAPTYMIANLKNSKSGTSVASIVNTFDELCSKFQNTNEGNLLQYHYAWLLDTIGKKSKAAEILARIFSSDITHTSNKSQENTVTEIIKDYAKIQYAIIAGEKADYREALRVLTYFRSHQNKSHISELAESVTKGIQILQREVPKNENK